MEKRFFLFVLAVFVAFLTFGQTAQQKKAIGKIDSQIKELVDLKILFQDIEDLNSRISPPVGQYGPEELEKKALESRVNALTKRLNARQRAFATSYADGETVQRDIEHLQEQKKILEEEFIAQTIEQKVPKELNLCEVKRRKRSLDVREGESSLDHTDKLRELSIQKLESASVEADPVKGYKGLLFNDTRYTKVTFVIKGAQDIDEVSQPLYAKEFREVYLLPGEYDVHTYVDGYLVQKQKMRVRPQANPIKINGKDYNFAVIRDKDGRY